MHVFCCFSKQLAAVTIVSMAPEGGQQQEPLGKCGSESKVKCNLNTLVLSKYGMGDVSCSDSFDDDDKDNSIDFNTIGCHPVTCDAYINSSIPNLYVALKANNQQSTSDIASISENTNTIPASTSDILWAFPSTNEYMISDNIALFGASSRCSRQTVSFCF